MTYLLQEKRTQSRRQAKEVSIVVAAACCIVLEQGWGIPGVGVSSNVSFFLLLPTVSTFANCYIGRPLHSAEGAILSPKFQDSALVLLNAFNMKRDTFSSTFYSTDSCTKSES